MHPKSFVSNFWGAVHPSPKERGVIRLEGVVRETREEGKRCSGSAPNPNSWIQKGKRKERKKGKMEEKDRRERGRKKGEEKEGKERFFTKK